MLRKLLWIILKQGKISAEIHPEITSFMNIVVTVKSRLTILNNSEEF